MIFLRITKLNSPKIYKALRKKYMIPEYDFVGMAIISLSEITAAN